jgi:hypothetical protein
MEHEWEVKMMPLVNLLSSIEKEAETLVTEIKHRNEHQQAIALGVGS